MADQRPQIISIPLDGSRQDDVTEFVQTAPTYLRNDNVRYRKQGEVEKTLPESSVAGPSVSGNIVGTGVAGDKFVLLEDDGTCHYYTESQGWASVESNLIPMQNQKALQTQSVAGAREFTFARASNKTLVAYCVRKTNSTAGGEDLPTDAVVIEVYDDNTGALLYRNTNNGFGPRATIDDSGTYFRVHYINGTTLRVDYALIASPTSWTTFQSTGLTLYTDDFWGDRNGGTDQNRRELRLGFQKHGGNCPQYIITPDDHLVWKSPSNGIYAALLNGTGVSASGTTQIVASNLTWLLGADSSGRSNAYDLGILIASQDGTGSTWLAGVNWYWRNGGSLSATASFNVLSNSTERTYLNGSVNVRSAGVGDWAVTRCDTVPTRGIMEDIGDSSYVYWGDVDTNSSDTEGSLANYRLASTLAIGPNGERCAVLEQWIPTEPVANQAQVSINPLHSKGVTAILVELGDTFEYKLRSQFDAGQSRSVNASSAEQSSFVPYLNYTGGKFEYLNRVQQQPEDLHKVLGSQEANDLNSAVLYNGEFQGRLYEVDTPTKLQTQEYGRTLIFNTSIPSQFDGRLYGELQPLDQPEVVLFRNDLADPLVQAYNYITFGGFTVDQYRLIQVITGFVDAQGALHRSAAAFPMYVEGNMNADEDGNRLTRDVAWTTPLTAFDGKSDYFTEVYVGQGSETTQLATSKRVRTDTGLITWADCNTTVFDTFLPNVDPVRSSEVIYTAGGVLDSDAWPSFTDFVLTSNRMFAISDAADGTLYYSKLFEENIAPEFSASLVIPLGRARNLTAIGAIDDKVIVFSENEVFAIYGTGPDNTGSNGDFIVDRLQIPFGVDGPDSLVEIPQGLMFWSNVTGEFHILTKDLQIMDIGKAVMDASEQITSVQAATIFPQEHEVRFYVTNAIVNEFGDTRGDSSGPARPRFGVFPENANNVLVYNYHYDKWSMNTNVSAVGAHLWNQKCARYVDNTLYYSSEEWQNAKLIKLVLPWIRFSTLQGYGRIEEIAFAGKYLSSWIDNGGGIEAGDIQVTIAYDYEGYAPDTDVYIFNAQDGDLGVESADRMQFSVHPGRPKCQAVQITIEEIATTQGGGDPSYSVGRGFALSCMDMTFQQKRGLGTKTKNQAASK